MPETVELHLGKATTIESKARKLPEVLGGVGRPVAFYPSLVPFLGSVNATILFCQLFYWSGRSIHGYTYKTSDALEQETGLSYAQQRTARKKLKSLGILGEHHARLQHEIHYWIEVKQLSKLWQDYRNRSKANAA